MKTKTVKDLEICLKDKDKRIQKLEYRLDHFWDKYKKATGLIIAISIMLLYSYGLLHAFIITGWYKEAFIFCTVGYLIIIVFSTLIFFTYLMCYDKDITVDEENDLTTGFFAIILLSVFGYVICTGVCVIIYILEGSF